MAGRVLLYSIRDNMTCD